MPVGRSHKQFITRYKFQKDRSRLGRSLYSVKVGDVHISRLVVQPQKKIGNSYYKKTNIVFFVEYGRVRMKCVQVNTKEEKEMMLTPGNGIIHLPPYTALAFKNLARKREAILIFFSNKALRGSDEYDFEVYPEPS